MNLIMFPESASLRNGYGIAVDYGYDILSPSTDDLIVWYTDDKALPRFKDGDVWMQRPGLVNAKRFKNMIMNRVGPEVTVSDLRFLKGKNFDNIHCDDVIFYRALRKLYPTQHLTIRFHNCYARIQDRKEILGMHLNIKFEINLRALTKLEREIFRDKNVHKIFLSEEDKGYYTSMTGRSDASVWAFDMDKNKAIQNRTTSCFDNKLVWFGGVQDHKIRSVNWFIEDVFPQILAEIPSVEFHLWGRDTEPFDNPDQHVFGHGVYSGNDIPLKDTALYINPDIIGGGVKLKLKSYFEGGVPFITTYFGFEGYNKDLLDDKYCIVSEMDKWADTIISLLNNKNHHFPKKEIYSYGEQNYNKYF